MLSNFVTQKRSNLIQNKNNTNINAQNMNKNKNFAFEHERDQAHSVSPTPLCDSVDLSVLTAPDAFAAPSRFPQPTKTAAPKFLSFVAVAPCKDDLLHLLASPSEAEPVPEPLVEPSPQATTELPALPARDLPAPLPALNRTPPVVADEHNDYVQNKLKFFRKLSARPRRLAMTIKPLTATSASSPSSDDEYSPSPQRAPKQSFDSPSSASPVIASPVPSASPSVSTGAAPSALTAALLAHKLKLSREAEQSSSLPAAKLGKPSGLQRTKSLPQNLNRAADAAPAKGPSSRAHVSFAKEDDEDSDGEDDWAAVQLFPAFGRAKPTLPVAIPSRRRPLPKSRPVTKLAPVPAFAAKPEVQTPLRDDENAPRLPQPSPSLLSLPKEEAQLPVVEAEEQEAAPAPVQRAESPEPVIAEVPNSPAPQDATGSCPYQPSPELPSPVANKVRFAAPASFSPSPPSPRYVPARHLPASRPMAIPARR